MGRVLLLPSHGTELVKVQPGVLMSSLFWSQYDCISESMVSWKELLRVLNLKGGSFTAIDIFFTHKKNKIICSAQDPSDICSVWVNK